MLNVTRTWNSVSAVRVHAPRPRARARLRAQARRVRRAARREAAAPRHARAGCRPSSRRRSISRSSLVELLGRARKRGELDDEGSDLLRLLTPIAKLTTGKQAVAVRQRGVGVLRRRGLRRGHRAAGAAARRAGAADLGGHDQRAVAGCAADRPAARIASLECAPRARTRRTRAHAWRSAWWRATPGSAVRGFPRRDRESPEAEARRFALVWVARCGSRSSSSRRSGHGRGRKTRRELRLRGASAQCHYPRSIPHRWRSRARHLRA